MIAVIQRVRSAQVEVNNNIYSSIGRGILCFVAVLKGDSEEDASYIANRLPKLRIFPDEKGKMNLSLIDISGEILLVSQFTLAADLKRGLRPGFDLAEEPEKAQRLLEFMVKSLTLSGVNVKTGLFGAEMLVKLENDGPATFVINTRERTGK